MANDMSGAPPPAAAPSRHPILVTSIVAFASFMEMLDATIIVMALPQMADAFGASPVELSLGLTAYMLAIAILVPTSGWVADRFGARNVFCLGIGAFTLASLLCGFATSLWQFVALRFLQGAGGAMMSPVGRLVVLHEADKRDLVRALNLLAIPSLIGPVLGPPVGGFLASYASWRWIFFVNVPIGLLGMVLVYLFIAERRSAARRPFDLKGFALNGTALSLLIYGMDAIAGNGPGWRTGAALVALAAGIGWLALRHARSDANPLVDLWAMRVRTFAVPSVGGSLVRIALAAPAFILPLLLQVGLGMSAFLSGVVILAHTLGDLVIKAVTTRTLRIFGFRATLVWSGMAFAASIAACAFFTPATPAWLAAAVLFASGVARSLQMTAQNALQFADVPRDRFTAASTLAAVIQQVMRSLGVAIAAIVINLSAALAGGGDPGLWDFRVSLIATAAIGLASLYWYVPLARDTAAEVSGQRQ